MATRPRSRHSANRSASSASSASSVDTSVYNEYLQLANTALTLQSPPQPATPSSTSAQHQGQGPQQPLTNSALLAFCKSIYLESIQLTRSILWQSWRCTWMLLWTLPQPFFVAIYSLIPLWVTFLEALVVVAFAISWRLFSDIIHKLGWFLSVFEGQWGDRSAPRGSQHRTSHSTVSQQTLQVPAVHLRGAPAAAASPY